jgi:hypothetical protein
MLGVFMKFMGYIFNSVVCKPERQQRIADSYKTWGVHFSKATLSVNCVSLDELHFVWDNWGCKNSVMESPWSKVLTEKLRGPQLLKNSAHFMEP